MPTQVTFRYGTKAQYDALVTKDEGCLYFLIDNNNALLYKGDKNITRYLISAVPSASNPENIGSFRITDKVTGQVYDVPLLSAVGNLLDDNLVLRFSGEVVSSDAELLRAIGAADGQAASGNVKAGTVFRVDDAQDYPLRLNPGQFAKNDALIANQHDLVIALYDLESGVITKEENQRVDWLTNHDLFAVIPTDLVDLVTAMATLDNNKVILGNGGHVIKAMPFAGANKVLRTNANNDGVEWATPETVENVVYWEEIV